LVHMDFSVKYSVKNKVMFLRVTLDISRDIGT